ncbi:hypothetical protein BU24DRAFT_281382 [Aaosphaeria arxii CBS 175.79]|uniref:Uncharacterized protein n=1 Tax=Aaosphaeria arxii CBS 175.79 TaxID=1450172 RepID=A0A6A5XGF9_9PLEO|nr:uncharacterized protein BU24DRAFT_281382 [Aaosphaeria arxii CBS 175.79]KAF2011454.1 hypothetical protein BU24DRAFT_281382 [Aaosphaeria arxii CBS 175.79]
MKSTSSSTSTTTNNSMTDASSITGSSSSNYSHRSESAGSNTVRLEFHYQAHSSMGTTATTYSPLIVPRERWTWPESERYREGYAGGWVWTRREVEELVERGLLVVDDVGIKWAVGGEYFLYLER